ncbi:hypothetical protein [Streptomyces kronopolitis]|uniref:hypothetical protein n=1 Tax=Streptomyces kronopolitis TaxID=1612435 RepID=UPI003D973B37
MQHTTTHPLAGQTVTVAPAAALFSYAGSEPIEFRVDDWNDRAFGQSWKSWMDMEGHPASLSYAQRAAVGHLPLDNDVVYGRDARGLGHLFHTSEITGGAQ